MTGATDTYGTSIQAPFPARTIVPDPSEASGLRAKDFPAVRSHSVPR